MTKTNKEVLSEATGLSGETIDEVWAEVKANAEKLNACIRPHVFTLTKDIRERPKCEKCGGVVNRINALYYNEGLSDARKEGI